ncbi:hypothetical protein DN536_39375, partial [Burkholderia multivorans]
MAHPILPIPNKGSSDWSYAWVPIVGPILGGVLAGGVIWSDATTTPKLALDLEGGTSIILEPQVSEDTTISKEQLDQ